MISIIIPTLNSEETLNACLSSITSNKTKYDYEIILVDGGSSDKTISVSKKYTDKIFIKENAGTGRQRNFGVKKAKGKIICFTDSDCIVPKNWIDSLVDNLKEKYREDKNIVGVGGSNTPLLVDCSLMEKSISEVMRSPLVAFKARNVMKGGECSNVLHNPPVNSCCFKWVLEEVGGFGDSVYGEDLELDAKITERGYALFYIPDIIVKHRHRSSVKKFSKQMYNFGKARISVGKKYKKFLNFYHYGPLILTLMLFTPLFFIPLLASFINGVYITVNERNLLILPFTFILTLIFYISYGLGEGRQLLK